jgi:benzil reductase ((S)-benzoin forming)
MSYAAYTIKDTRPALALVTGGRSGIGKAIAEKIATFPFIENVLVVSRKIQGSDVNHPKLIPIAADVGTSEGRQKIIQEVDRLCENHTKRLRFLVHSAGIVEPIASALNVTQEEFRRSMTVNVEAPFLLTTAMYPYLVDDITAGRVLHVSSGAAHGSPPVGWSVYGISSKAAFFQSFQVLDKEFCHLGGKVRVGSFKPGVVDTAMQVVIRETPQDAMPLVANFQSLKENVDAEDTYSTKARPPPKVALDTPENVAFFAEWLLLGTANDEFSNRDDKNEYDIRNPDLFSKWIPPESLPKE